MFQVFDNNKPADCHHCAVGSSWDVSSFETLELALEYAEDWLGEVYNPGQEFLRQNALNQPWKYNGGDTIEIREV